MGSVDRDLFECAACPGVVNHRPCFSWAVHTGSSGSGRYRCSYSSELLTPLNLPENRGAEAQSGENGKGDQRSGSFHTLSFVGQFVLNRRHSVIRRRVENHSDQRNREDQVNRPSAT